MTTSSAARKLDDAAPVAPAPRREFAGGGGPPVRPNVPILNNAELGVIMLLGAELMFFAGLIGAFLVFRLSATVWPPPFQPRLPIGVTGVNTVILLVSALTVHWAVGAARAGAAILRYLAWTALLGALFLLIQGYEWLRMIHFGLTTSSSVYGGLFYTLIGAHGVHVIGGLIWLTIVCWQATRGRFTKKDFVGVQTARMYWTFVVALWPVLYGLVYLY
ncbi:MAG TPA: cytochrome c oxidase subunit 3 [Candidatus Deferrimicrobium sp.]|nr:cytochrome c oxidase subunit 3 [Candidatus Deferrimicrobium sp.]